MSDIPPPIAAVFSALRFSEPRHDLLRSLTGSEWEGILSRWGIRRLMIPLRLSCGDDLPSWVRDRIDRNLADNAQRFERIKTVYLEFADASGAAGVEHVIIKGFAQSPDFAEHPRLRLQSDIDIYCPPESIGRARDTLLELGYEPLRGLHLDASDHLATMVRKGDWKWRGNFYDPEMPVSFELHFCLWNEKLARFSPGSLEGFWFRRVERRLDDFSFPALALIDNLGYSALNVVRDTLQGPVSVQLVYEVAKFLEANADNDALWKTWRELHDESLRRLEVIAFRLASIRFGCRLPEEFESDLEALPAAAKSWLARYADSPFSAAFRENKDAMWLHLALIEDSRSKRAVLFDRLFPTQVPLFDAPYIPKAAHERESSGVLQKHRRYASYLFSRVCYHARTLPTALWHGARLWSSTVELDRSFIGFLGFWLLINFGIYIFYFLYNLYLLDRGLRENILGLTTSAMTFGGVAGAIPAGILAHRAGIRNALLICLTLLSLVSALRLIFISTAPLLALAFIAGSVMSILPVVLTPSIAQLTSEKSRAFGFSVVLSCGIGLGIVGGQVAGRLPGWLMQISLFANGVRAKEAALALACGVMALAAIPASRLKFASRPARDKRVYPRNPFLSRFLIAIAMWSFAIGGFSPFFNVYFSRYLHTALKQMGTIYSISHLSQLLAMLAAPVVFRRLGLVTGIVCAQIATAVALACLATASSSSAATSIYMGYVMFQWMSEPGVLSLLMNQIGPKERTGASALNHLVANTAQAIAATIAGISFVRFGYPAVLAVLAGVALSSALTFKWLLGTSPARAHQQVPAENG